MRSVWKLLHRMLGWFEFRLLSYTEVEERDMFMLKLRRHLQEDTPVQFQVRQPSSDELN